MSYSLTLSNGNPVPGLGPSGLQDGTINTGSTSLSLVGKNYPGYGALLNENFVHILENFANTTSPSNALPGQLWWDSNAKVLKVNTALAAGTSAIWKSLTSIISTAPITDESAGTVGTPKDIQYAANVGDLWWDTANKQLKLFSAVQTDGAAGWITIGPAANTSSGQSGAVAESILDNFSVSHVVIKFYISNNLTAILSKDAEFIPGTSIPGFSTVKPGFNLSTEAAQLYNGTATAALNLVVNGVVVSANSFTRSDIVTTSNVSLNTTSNDGITIGTIGNLVANVSSVTGHAGIYITDNNKDIILYTKTAGVTTPVFKVTGQNAEAAVYASPITNNGIANKLYVDNSITALNSAITNQVVLRNGSNTITGNLVPSANASINLGSSTAWFSNIYGVSMQARYADLAERFAADDAYTPGTVVEIGGTKEITYCVDELSETVLGVISTDPAYLMNSGSGTDATHPAVALSGRVPVSVIGVVRKGDRLVSAGNGLARSALKGEITPWNVIGRALKDKQTPGIELVEAIVRINN